MAFWPKSSLRRYTLYFLGWTALGLFFFSQALMQKILSGDPSPWWHHLVSWLTGVYLLGCLTPFVLKMGRRFPFHQQYWMRIAARHLTFSFVFACTQLLVESALLFAFGVFPTLLKSYAATVVFLFVLSFHQNVLTYWIILGVQYAFRYYNQYRERERDALLLELRASELKAQLTRAHLSTLKTQLQPHFLFNTLNAIMVLVRQHKTNQAEEMLSRLSDLLRCVLDDVEAQEVPLRREFDYLRLYLSIEKVRFQDRLHVDISAPPELMDAAFPHMGLQPLVENAIRHGIGRRSAAGIVRITASKSDNTLKVAVQDDGPGFSSSHPSSPGIGLTNTRERLNQLYGPAAQLLTENAPAGGAIVTLLLPFHLASETTGLDLMEVHAFHDVDR